MARRDYNYFNLRPVYLKDRHMTFTGWYSDKACTQLVTDSDFVYIGSKTSAQDTPIFTSSTTLYAGWTSSRYVITFKAPDGCTLSGLDYDYEIQEEINGASTFICTIDKNSEDKSIGYRLPEVSYSDAQTDFYKWKLKSSGKEYTSEELMNYKFTKDDEVTPVSRRVCSITWNYGTEMVNHNAEEGSIFLEKADKGDEVYPYNGMENISRTKYVEGYYLDSSFTNPLIKAGEYSYKVTGNVIIYAKWADYYTVTFDLGSLYINGSHTIEKKYIKKGEVLDYCPEETPVSEGDRSSFNGWRKDGKQITPEEIKTLVVNENFTISADYDETVFIRFDVNTSSTTARVTYNLDWANNEYGVIAVKKGSNLSGYEFPGASYAQNNVTYEGNSTEYYKTFEGWFRDKACSVPVDRNSYIANENDTFYAKWGTDTFYTITFVNTRPGLGEMCYGKAGLLLRYDHGDVFVPKGAPYAFNGVDVGEGYEFPHIVIDEDNRQTLEALPTGEWSTKEDGTGQRWFLDGKRGYYIDETGNKHSFAPGTFVPTKDMTFYSVWDEGITVTLDLNGGNADRDDGYRYIDNPFTVRENGTKLTARLPEGISYEELEQLIPVRLSNDSEKSIFWGYKDKACSDAFKGSDVLTQDTTVYALYTSHSEATLAFYSTDEGYFVTTQNGKTEKTGSKIYKVNVPAKGVYKTELDIPVTGDDHKAFSGMYAPSRNGDTPDLSRPCPYTVYEDGKWYLAVNNKYVNNSNYLAAYTDASVVTVDAGEYGHFGDTRGVRREIVAAGRDIELSKYEELLIPNDGAWPLGWYYRDSNNIEQKLIVTWTESGKTLYKPTGDIDIYYKWGIGSTGRRVENVDVSANNATVLEIGEKKSLLSTLSPSGVNADVTWYLADVTYGNSNRAKECPVILKSDGTVTGRAEGTAKVYAIADGKRSDDVTVTVSSEPSVNGLKEPYCTPYVENGGERIVTKGTRVILGSSTPGALIMYALDDGEYSVYSNAIVIAKDTVIKAYAISENFNRSAEVTFSFRLSEDYGDIDEALMNSIFEGSVANVPSDLWFALKSEETGEYVRIDNLDPNTAHTGKSAALAKATGLSFVYTGSKITFNDSIRVFYGKNRLIEGRDYNVSYANNTAVASETALKTPGFTVSGKGNYSGAMNFKFGITCADINGAEITTEKEVCLSSGSKLSQVAPKLAFNGKKLSLNKDYVLNYYVGSVGSNNLITASELKNFKAEVGKTYVVEIAGKEGGNFTASSKTETVLVKAYDSSNKSYVQASKLKIGDVKGKAVKIPYADRTAMSQEPDEYLDTLFDNRDGKTPVICVFNAKNVLTYNKDFTVDLVRSADFPELADEHYYAGTYSFVISGVSKEESGLSEGEVIVVGSKIASYEITGTPMKNVKLAGLATTVEYTGKEISLSDLFNARDKNLERDWMAVTLYTADKSKTKHALTEGADYSVSMKNTGKVGQFSLEFVGKNGYSGGIKKTITVKPYNLKDDALKMLNITIGDQHVYYSKAGAKCKDVTVRFGDDMILREGIDYTLSYKNNSKVADAAAAGSKAPMLLVTGKGNFTGASAAKTFTIEKAPFDTDHISFAIDDVKYNSNGKDGYFMPSAKFTDGGKAIAIGRDKDIELPDKYDYRYFYIGTATMTDGTIRNDGEEADPKDRPVAGTAIGVEVYVTCPEKSPYYSKGTIKGSYRVIDASKDISSAKVTVKDASGLVFSGGMEIIPMSEDDIKVTVNGKELSSEEYRIVSVSDNRFIGTATVTIEGTGEYGGRKIFKFKISARAVS
ncbi:MAG: chitobiase/beta-hexosaminidase C-terminal domain-containing protein [Butyrivibrio sp.]|nr:chitobiase/beta-hexosaminidase C-terminal domain-containing protein [Butyrivibrio sp.]